MPYKLIPSTPYFKAALKECWDNLFEASLAAPVETPIYESFEPDFK